MDIYDYYEILKDKYIRVAPKDVKGMEKVDYLGAHESCRYRIVITNDDNHGEHYVFKTKEERDKKFQELLFILNTQKITKRMENAHEQ